MKNNVFKFIEVLERLKPVKKATVDNDFDLGYSFCHDQQHVAINKAIEELKKGVNWNGTTD